MLAHTWGNVEGDPEVLKGLTFRLLQEDCQFLSGSKVMSMGVALTWIQK